MARKTVPGADVASIIRANEALQPRADLVTVPRFTDLPFITRTVTKRGRMVSMCDFDVPDEEYAQGFLTGSRAFAALFKRMCDGPPCDLVMVAEAAAEALAESAFDMPNRRGAGAGFFRALEALVKHAAATNTITHSATVMHQIVFFAELSAKRETAEKAAKAAKASTRRSRRSGSAATAGAAK